MPPGATGPAPEVPGQPPAWEAPIGPDEPTRAGSGSALSPDSGSGTGFPDPSGNLEGRRLAGYQLLEELHRGGQGVVYRAIQLGTKRQVALKVLLEGPFASEAARRRFEREIELAASLQHPAIVTILESGVSDGCYYFAMEYIEGLRLDRYLAQKRPPLRETLRLFEKICAAVNYAHQRGVIHRDLKPPNILVDEQGEPHILDFGLAKPMPELGSERSTVRVLSTSGQIVGTVAYMSPEQALGSQDIDVRSDVYSLGVLFYEALLGEFPYPIEGPLGDVLSRIARAEPRRPRLRRRRSRFGSLLDEELETILLKALEKDPARRYQTAGDLGRDIHHVLAGEPIEAKRASGWYVFRKTLRRYRLQTAAASVLLVMLIGFLVVFAFLWSAERDAAARALLNQQLAAKGEIRERQARRALERALVLQTIQRGRLAQAQGDLVTARGLYWDAYENPQQPATPAAVWALRQYYAQTGDAGARLLFAERHGPVVLSPDGRLAAVTDGERSVALRDLEQGVTVAWRRVPAPVESASVSDDGTLAVAGRNQAWLWRPGSVQPALSTELPAGFDLRAIQTLPEGAGMVLVGGREVRLATVEQPGKTRRAALFGLVAGTPDYDPERDLLAVPTTAGVELVRLGIPGELRTDLVGLREVQPRLVRFAGDEMVAVTEDTAYRCPVSGPSLGFWQPFLRTLPGWTHFDLQPDRRQVVLGLPDGRVILYQDGQVKRTWQVARESLLVLRFEPAGEGILTVDASGTLTRWIDPQGRQGDRLIHDRLLRRWETAADGSAVMLADDRDRVFVYTPRYDEFDCEPVRLRRPRLPWLAEDLPVLMALSHDADRLFVGRGETLRLQDRPLDRVYNAVWSEPDVPRLTDAALSDDGGLLALCAQTEAGERQEISFWRWEPQVQTMRRVELTALLPQARPPIRFEGSVIRDMRFIPRSHRLLVARSNGDLLILPETGTQTQGSAQPAWVRLDSPPVVLACDRSGRTLAVACEDGFVRLITVNDGEIRARTRFEQPVRSLAFGPRGDVLLVCTAGGRLHLYEVAWPPASTSPAELERVAQWQPPEPVEPELALWIGDRGLLLSTGRDGVHVRSLAQTDELIERDRVYARQRTAIQALRNGDYNEAWRAARNLERLAPAVAREMETFVLETLLRHPNETPPPEWIRTVISGAEAERFLKLGHAAYEGERYPLAGKWLKAAQDWTGGEVDAETALRIAQCDYLLGNYVEAAGEFGRVAERPDLPRERLPWVWLQQAAALVLAGEPDQARAITRQLDQPDVPLSGSEKAALEAVRNIAQTLTQSSAAPTTQSGEKPVAALVAQFVGELTAESIRGFYASYYDDVHFFSGELARARGDLDAARADYRRCLEVARDAWPSNWARFRLRQLSRTAQ